MNRIASTFQQLKKINRTAFIAFLTAGDPDLQTTRKLLLEMQNNGCDIIEIGIPFSDPAADGPEIQAASIRALQHRIKTADIMAMVKDVRHEIHVPLVYLLYYNQIFTYGAQRFIRDCADAGIDGLIIPDLPMEHQMELLPLAQAADIALISLVTPISAKRKQQIAMHANGFLYCVTSTGVTGTRAQFKADLKAFIDELNQYSDIPKALGFGISNVEQILELKAYADGIIVGSAIVREIAKLSSGEASVQDVGAFVKTLCDACHQQTPTDSCAK